MPLADPYPVRSRRPAIAAATYVDDLVLRRSIAAVKARSGGDADYVVGAPYRVRYRLAGETAWGSVKVPAGLTTDLSSVPRPVWSLINRVGPHLEASIVHDWLYVAWQDVPGRGARPEDRRFADDLFLALMKEAKVGWLKRQAIYRAVRLFGWAAYRSQDPGRHAAVPV